jgi:PHS family inorganic phosphate transporter-like MFS transporter
MSDNSSPWLSFLGTAFANISIQYNFNSIVIALIIMSVSECSSDDGNCKEGNQSSWVEPLSSATIFLGAVLGQLSMGVFGDIMGRSEALITTMSISAIFSILSAVAPSYLENNSASVYTVIIICRFFLGYGLGGVYPLAAAKSAEDGSKEHSYQIEFSNEDSFTEVLSDKNDFVNPISAAWSFVWQMPGMLLPYLIAIMLILNPIMSTSEQWRLVLGLGSIPSILCVICLLIELFYKKKSYEHLSSTISGDSINSINNVNSFNSNKPTKESIILMLKDRKIIYKLVGSGGTWFFYDIILYGVSLFGAKLLEDINADIDDVSKDSSIIRVCEQQLKALSLSIPAVLIVMYILPKLGLKKMQIISFITMAFCLLFMAIAFHSLHSHSPRNVFILYCLLTMSLFSGVGITTYSLSACLFPKEVRTTLGGVSSAMGKFGAILGAYCFKPVADVMSLTVVLLLCCGISIVGAIVSYQYISLDEYNNPVPEQEDSLRLTEMSAAR